MSEMIEKIRERLNKLVENEAELSSGEILKLSQELDVLIYNYYEMSV